jgi:hypothetical protein
MVKKQGARFIYANDEITVYAFNIGFYALPLMADIGYAKGFGTLAAINFATLLPLVFLIFKGEGIRRWQGVPADHSDL